MRGAGPLLALALLAVLLGPLATAGAAGAAGAPAAFATQADIEPDAVSLDVTLHDDGDATWRIGYRVRLDDENDTAAFESLEEDVEADPEAYAEPFAERMAGTVAAAENATGREMAVRNVTVRTDRQELGQRYGVLVYSFEWTNFAVVEGDEIRAGDAIGGLFLDGDTSLTLRWPAGYHLASADPAADETGDRSATWRGPTEFAADQPRVVVTNAPPTTTTAPPADGAGGDGLSTAGLAAVAVGVLLAIGAGGWLFVTRGRVPAGSRPDAGGDRHEDEPEPDPDPDPEPPEELLSNEERVLKLLEERGGRMKQQQVVEALGWTDAKTSQVVSDLRESGEVDVFRLGRENVLTLPDEDLA